MSHKTELSAKPIEVLSGEVLLPTPERLRGDNVMAVADSAASHFVQLASESFSDQRSAKSAARGATVRLLSSLVAAGELPADFDAAPVIANLDAIGMEVHDAS